MFIWCSSLHQMQCKSAPLIQSLGHRVRCGKCVACRVKFRNDWAIRIRMESLGHYQKTGLWPWFLTFTYKPESVPLTVDQQETLNKKQLMQWIKNVQKDEAINRFRYFAVGEYGSRHGRPHYHMVLFPEDIRQPRQLEDRWQRRHGFTSSYILRDGAFSYITKYATKYMSRSEDTQKMDGKELEFRLSSRCPPLGQNFSISLLGRLDDTRKAFWLDTVGDVPRSFRDQGKVYPIPKFILDKTRQHYEIPTTEAERAIRCSTYYEYLDLDYEEPTWEPHEKKLQEQRFYATENQLKERSRGQKL